MVGPDDPTDESHLLPVHCDLMMMLMMEMISYLSAISWTLVISSFRETPDFFFEFAGLAEAGALTPWDDADIMARIDVEKNYATDRR